MRRRHIYRTIACVLIIMMLMGMVGCEATGLGMTFFESVFVAALVGSPALVAVNNTVRRWLWPKVTETSTDKEIIELMNVFREDVERWENEGGSVSVWD